MLEIRKKWTSKGLLQWDKEEFKGKLRPPLIGILEFNNSCPFCSKYRIEIKFIINSYENIKNLQSDNVRVALDCCYVISYYNEMKNIIKLPAVNSKQFQDLFK
jgi:hypothetical protein